MPSGLRLNLHNWSPQDRAITSFHPLRAPFEQVAPADPHPLDTETAAPFLTYGFEQPTAILKEVLCCAALAPDAARTARLRAILEPYFALPPAGQPLASQIILPWPGVEVAGICD